MPEIIQGGAGAGGQDPQPEVPVNDNPTPEVEVDEYNPFMDDIQEEVEPEPKKVDEEPEVDEETEKIVNTRVENRVKPIEEQLRKNEQKSRVFNFLLDERNKKLYGDLEPKVMDLLKRNPRVSDLKADALFRIVAGDIGNRIAKEQSEADSAATRTQTGKPMPRATEAPVQDALQMSDEEWKKVKAARYQEMGMGTQAF